MSQPSFWSEFKSGAKGATSFYRSILFSPYRGIKEGLQVSKELEAEGRLIEAAIVRYFAPLTGLLNAIRGIWAKPKP